MPQLMPIFWKNSILMVNLFMLMLMLTYFFEVESVYNFNLSNLIKLYKLMYLW